MSISVIITHFAPKINCDKYCSLLKDNINNLRNQVYDQNIEIILCDDGSYWTRDLYKNHNRNDILILDKDDINENSVFWGLSIDKYYGLPDVNRYRAVKLKDTAIRNSMYDKIVMLDDDHHFFYNNSIYLFSKYLDRYSYVKGRLIGYNNLPHLYISKNSQGTTYGFKKELYIKVNGFSDYLYDNANGEDNDILYRFFKAVTESQNNIKGCFAGDIITKDIASNRWQDRVKGMKGNDIIITNDDVHARFVTNFIEEHGVHPSKGNLSRVRYKWLNMSSFKSWLYEIKYLSYYLIYLKEYFKELKKIIMSKINIP